MNNIALVTGATRGLGRATASQLARAGFHVVVGSRTLPDGEKVVEEIKADHGTAAAIQLDVTDENSIRTAMAFIQREYGRLDVLANNAGVLVFDENDTVSLAAFTATYNVNVFGVVAMIEQAVPLLQASGNGQIVNISSEVGSFALMTDPNSDYFDLHMPAYISSKTAVNAITVQCAKVLARQSVRVNAINPGFIDTDMNGHTGTRPVQEAADDVVRLIQSKDGSTGKFFGHDTELQWQPKSSCPKVARFR